MGESLWDKYEASALNKGLTAKRISKLKLMYNTVKRGISKDLSKVKREDVEEFITRLHRNEFKKENGEPYSGSSKSDVKKFLKQFYKWLKGDDEYYPKEVSWLRVAISKDEKPQEKPVLTLEEINKVANKFTKIEYKILFLLLFDSGFRIGEMVSVRKRDLTFDSFQDEDKCFWVYCPSSKTIARKVPIPLFTEDIKQFVGSSYYMALENDDLIWPMSYNAINGTIKYACNKAIGKNISPHALRHSSATYYSRVFDGNMNLIAERYGWSFDSKELKTYIRRSGVYQKIGAKKVYDNQLIRLQKEIDKLKKDIEDIKNTIITSKVNKVKRRKAKA